ncbi:MAG: LacI family DNA-binding transcriptional regulator [Candidatus Methylacidiphilales bacterium]|nr:LacI family DNA-binding transcriptional regulator [Candidatus Methylacidiphilales bacterium]
MTDLASAAGVSKNTISLALRNDPQISADTRARIRTLARKMGYQTHPVVAHLMTQLRLSRTGRFRACLALVNANRDPKAFRRHPTVPSYVEGCRRRAKEAGYELDEFWLHDPEVSTSRLVQILHTRGISGVLLVGLMSENRLPEERALLWNSFLCIVTGVRTRQPALSFACADHHDLAFRAVRECLALGYRRPGLVLDGVIDELVDRRFSSGFTAGQAALPRSARTRPFFDVSAADRDRSRFNRWLGQERPDVILTLYNRIRDWVEEAGLRVPEDLGLVQLEWRKKEPEWAGMDQHNDVVGEAAVDMLIGLLQRSDNAVPEFPRATLIGSTWRTGSTLKS